MSDAKANVKVEYTEPPFTLTTEEGIHLLGSLLATRGVTREAVKDMDPADIVNPVDVEVLVNWANRAKLYGMLFVGIFDGRVAVDVVDGRVVFAYIGPCDDPNHRNCRHDDPNEDIASVPALAPVTGVN